jgi:low temperature requirement protein LtrA
VGYTFYADRFESDDPIYRLLVLFAMLAIVGVAVNTPFAFSRPAASRMLAASYLAVRLTLLVLYVRAYRHELRARPLCGRYLVGFSIGAGFWLVSVFVGTPARYELWALGLVAELITPLLSSSAISGVPYHASHIPERFGSFTIIVLGETVILTATGVTSQLRAQAGIMAAIGFFVTACLWWIYFEFVDASPFRRGLVAGQTFVYGHLLVFLGITATGAGVLLAAHTGNRFALSAGERWALCGGPAAFLLAIGAIHLVNARRVGDGRAWTRFGTATAVCCLAAFGGKLFPLRLEGLLLALLIVHAALETWREEREAVDGIAVDEAPPST